MEFEDIDLNALGTRVAAEWGGECISHEITPSGISFTCIEHGEVFDTKPLTMEEIQTMYKEYRGA